MENKQQIILDIVDMQNDFMAPDGKLSLNCPEIAEKANEFFKELPQNYFDKVLIKRDTHFANFYEKTAEGNQFPPHCIYGTEGWDLAIDISQLKENQNVYFLNKDAFDMWAKKGDAGYKPNEENGLADFSNTNEKIIYDRLYSITAEDGNFLIDYRENFLENEFGRANIEQANLKNTTVYLMGVAADICNRFAIKGYLERGAKVTVIEDLTKGIEKQTPQIVEELKSEMNLEEGQLQIIKSKDLIDELKQTSRAKLKVVKTSTSQTLKNEG